MTTTNRVRVSHVRESIVGVTPTTPRMRLQRVTSVGLTAAPRFVDTAELRSDRMVGDSIETLLPSGGGSMNFEFSYPEASSPFADDLASAMYANWVNTPTFYNDGTADSVITDAGTTTDTYVVTSGGNAVKAGMLVKAEGFTNAANNQVFKAVDPGSSDTTIAGTSLSLTTETAPPATAKLKVVGFQGAAGDFVAAADGITCTVADFTTFGLVAGQWIKIGGTATGDKFVPSSTTNVVARAIIVSGGTGGTPGAVTITGTTGTSSGSRFQATGTIGSDGVLRGALSITVRGAYTTDPTNTSVEPVTGGSLSGATVKVVMVAANINDWARITTVAAKKLTLDNLPTGWITDSGATKTIKIWFGDYVKNGTTQLTATKEIEFGDQEVPGYFLYKGLSVNTADFTLNANAVITGTFNYNGREMTPSNLTVDSSPDAATTNRVMAAHANVGRLSEAGRVLSEPNWGNALTFQLNNNQRELLDVGSQSVAGVNPGSFAVTGRITLYFGDLSLYSKLIANTPTSLSTRWQKDSQAVIFSFPRITFRGGDPQITGSNQDVVLPLDFVAAADPTLNSMAYIHRIYYYES